MEGAGENQSQNQQTRSTLATDLFGPKIDPSASVFASIFPPPKSNSAFEKKSVKQWVPPAPEKKGEGSSTYNNEANSYYQDTKVRPFQYNSSIYYGGQEVYTPPQPAQTPSHFAPLKKDGEDDDGQASRGNWWQGSLYY